MFSDRHRSAKMILLAIPLFGLCLYGFLEGPRRFPGVRYLAEHTLDQQGTPIDLAFARVMEAVGPGEFRLRVAYGELVRVRFREGAFRKGDVVSVTGRLLPQGHVEAEAYTLHPLRWLKKLVSLVGALSILLLVATRYRLSPRTLTLEDRKGCRT